MPLRRLGRFGSGTGDVADTAQETDCGSEAMVSGGSADPLGAGTGSQEQGDQQAQASRQQEPQQEQQPQPQQQQQQQQQQQPQQQQQQQPQPQQQQQQQPQPQQQQQQQPQRTAQQRFAQNWSGGRSARPSRNQLEQSAGELFAALNGAKEDLAKEMEANLKQLKGILQDTQRIAKEMEAIMKEAKADPSPAELSRGTGQSNWHPPGGKQSQQQDEQDQQKSAQPPAWQVPQAGQENEQHAP